MENYTALEPYPKLTLREHVNGLTLTTVLAILAAIYVAQSLYTIIYNLHFHPLAHFPGPRLAAATSWYQCWYEVFKLGEFVHKLEELHEQYGPVVRTTPNELHFSSPEAWKAIYSTSVFVKDDSLYKIFGRSKNSFTLISPPRHKERREQLATHFSRKSILELQGLIQDKIETLCDAWKVAAATTGTINLTRSFRSATCDIVTTYLFGKDLSTLSHASTDFDHPLVTALNDTILIQMPRKHFPLFDTFCYVMLPTLLRLAGMAETGLGEVLQTVENQVDEILANPAALKEVKQKTIYHDLVFPTTGTSLGREELILEAQAHIFAGSDTVGNALAIGNSYLLNAEGVQEKLFAELKTAWPVPEEVPRLEQLDKLPYLVGVVKECVRFSHGVSSPLTRVATTELNVAGIWVPAGTQLGVSVPFVNLSPALFPDPEAFKPERWAKTLPGDIGNLGSFSRGVRGCIGKQLALAEMTMIIAAVYRRFELEFVEGKYLQKDLKSLFNPYTTKDARVKLRVRED